MNERTKKKKKPKWVWVVFAYEQILKRWLNVSLFLHKQKSTYCILNWHMYAFRTALFSLDRHRKCARCCCRKNQSEKNVHKRIPNNAQKKTTTIALIETTYCEQKMKVTKQQANRQKKKITQIFVMLKRIAKIFRAEKINVSCDRKMKQGIVLSLNGQWFWPAMWFVLFLLRC